jgi:hypothetical protein
MASRGSFLPVPFIASPVELESPRLRFAALADCGESIIPHRPIDHGSGKIARDDMPLFPASRDDLRLPFEQRPESGPFR